MEDNQLNFNQPLLSVRRHSSTSVSEKEDRKKPKSLVPSVQKLPHYKSDLKSGHLRNPGTVPFVWEQSPGRRKDEESRPQSDYSERSSTAPKLPPGRTLKPDQQESDNAFAYPTAAEKIQVGNSHCLQVNLVKDKNDDGSEDDEDPITEDESSDSTNNEVYVDALDTLSRTESFFFNCSVSGVSGFEDVQPSGTFSTDTQAKKDFMIGRFLPAAKAMASETPQLAYPKKQPIVQDQPRQLKNVVNGDNRPQLRYGPSFAKHHSEYYESEKEESDDDFDESEILQAKVCGLVPRFFLRGSHCLINRIPARSVRATRPPVSPVSREGTVSSASYWSKTEHEHSSFDTSGRKSIDGSLTAELHEEKNDLNMKTKHISSKLEGTYPHESIQASGMPHYASESKNTSNTDLNSPDKGYKTFKDMLSDKNSSEEVDSGSLEVEKTLYIDSVHKLDSTHKESCPSSVSLQRDQDHDILRKGTRADLSKESALVNESGAFVNEGDKPLKFFPQLPDFNVLTLSNAPIQKIEREAPKAFGQDQNCQQDANFEFTERDVSRSSTKQAPKTENLENTGGICPDFPIPPPLPKSPSDSWLWRTLPSISSKNSSSHAYFGTGPNPRHQGSKTQPSDDYKWENMSKTSKPQLQHLRFSEELLAPIPEN